jgi:hypothetical protein
VKGKLNIAEFQKMGTLEIPETVTANQQTSRPE